MKPFDAVLVTLWLVALALRLQAGGSVLPRAELPINADGFHCVVLREHGQSIASGVAAVLGSQEVEDAADAAGEYTTFWADETDVPAAYQDAIDRMRSGGLPQWCLCDSRTGRSYLGAVPDSVAAALAKIAEIGGSP